MWSEDGCMDNEKMYQIYENLWRSFEEDHVLLYLGRKADSAELPEELLALPWSGIVTSRREQNLLEEVRIIGQREPLQYKAGETFVETFETMTFSKNRMPVLFLFGWNGDEVEDAEDAVDNANDAMKSFLARMTPKCHLIFVGYDGRTAEGEVSAQKIARFVKKLKGRRLSFFAEEGSLDAKAWERLKAVGAQWYPCALEDVVEIGGETGTSFDSLLTGSEEESSEPTETFYRNGRPVAIGERLLQDTYYAELLTREKLEIPMSTGEIEMRNNLETFLEESSLAPQWYGYTPQAELYVKREFEDTLTALVENLLVGRNPAGASESGDVPPVILYGDPGSSKSVELAALAYRVFQERQCPVVYLKEPRLTFRMREEVLSQLGKLLFVLEQEKSTERPPRTLIVWDSASYQNVAELAGGLLKDLMKLGRNCVLVCTAYDQRWKGDDCRDDCAYECVGNVAKGDYRMERKKQHSFAVREDEHQAVLHQGAFYVYASRKMTDAEEAALKDLIAAYTGEDANEIFRRLMYVRDDGEEKHIFAYLYRLVADVREPLEAGLMRERQRGKEYILERYREMMQESDSLPDEEESPWALLKTLELPRDTMSSSSTEEGADAEERERQEQAFLERWKDFETCIALFSRFHLTAPYELAFRLLFEDAQDGMIYTERNRRMMDDLIGGVTHILEDVDAWGNDVFRFRLTLEAELYLRNKEVTPAKEVELVCKMLDIYTESMREGDVPGWFLEDSLLLLLEYLGPNSKYEFQGNEHADIQQHLEEMIKKLREAEEVAEGKNAIASLRKLASHEITFAREYYGERWDDNWRTREKPTQEDYHRPEDYRHRLEQLEKTYQKAMRLAEEMEKEEPSRGRNSREDKQKKRQKHIFLVELAHCAIQIDKRKREVEQKISDGVFPACAWTKDIQAFPYEKLHEKLLRAIAENPYNGYTYNALFWLFRQQYEILGEERAEERLEILSDILMVVYEAEIVEMENRNMEGEGDLDWNIAYILNLAEPHHVNIEAVERPTCSDRFLAFFEDMLKNGRPALLCMVGREELRAAGLERKPKEKVNGGAKLSEEQHSACKRVIDFLTKTESRKACVMRDAYALEFLIRVTWMYYDGYPLHSSVRWQTTHMPQEAWQKIYDFTVQYDANPHASRVILEMLRALAVVQLRGDYKEASSIMEEMNRRMEDAMPPDRMHAPFLLCDQTGKPNVYMGIVTHLENNGYRGEMELHEGNRKILGDKRSGIVRFRLSDLEKNGGVMTESEQRKPRQVSIGLMYTGSWAACDYAIVSERRGV